MPSLPADKLSARAPITSIPADTTVPLLLSPASQPTVALRNPRGGAAAIAAWLRPYINIVWELISGNPADNPALAAALSLKASIYTSIDYINEVELEDGESVNGFGLSFVLLGGRAVLYGGVGINPNYIGRTYTVRNPTTTHCELGFGVTTTATIDGAATLTLQPGEWAVLRLHAGGYNVVMRGRLDGAVLLPSPNGSLWRVTVDNTGAVGATPV